MKFITLFLISAGAFSLCQSCTNIKSLSHSHPDGITRVTINNQIHEVNHFPNKTLIGDKCYSMTNGNDPKSKPVIVTEEPYQNGCAGG